MKFVYQALALADCLVKKESLDKKLSERAVFLLFILKKRKYMI